MTAIKRDFIIKLTTIAGLIIIATISSSDVRIAIVAALASIAIKGNGSEPKA